MSRYLYNDYNKLILSYICFYQDIEYGIPETKQSIIQCFNISVANAHVICTIDLTNGFIWF